MFIWTGAVRYMECSALKGAGLREIFDLAIATTVLAPGKTLKKEQKERTKRKKEKLKRMKKMHKKKKKENEEEEKRIRRICSTKPFEDLPGNVVCVCVFVRKREREGSVSFAPINEPIALKHSHCFSLCFPHSLSALLILFSLSLSLCVCVCGAGSCAEELWLMVFAHLSARDLASASLVCHCFHRIANDPTIMVSYSFPRSVPLKEKKTTKLPL